MLRKLYSLVHQNGCKPDDPDSPMMQEILLPGHLYLGVLTVNKYKTWVFSTYNIWRYSSNDKGKNATNTN